MQIKKPPPKCARCGRPIGRNGVHCHSVMTNGCANYYCLFVCWPEHAKGHDAEWDAMTEQERDAITQERVDNG